MKPLEIVVVIVMVLLLAMFFTCSGAAFIAEVPLLVFLGWIIFLVRTVPQMTTEPLALGVGAAALVGFTVLAHGLARGLAIQWRPADSPGVRWKFRWTLAGVGMLLAMSAAGIAMLVSVHQFGWLAHSDEPWLESSWRAGSRVQSNNNLRQIGIAAHNYLDRSKTFPAGGTFNESGEAMHSWETALLPHLEAAGELSIDQNLPWTHPANAPQFKKPLGVFLNPSFREEPFNAEGYALSHYAANCRVWGPNQTLRPEDVTDGMSKTIMAGEVCEGFRPWGDPVNWRDPALGLNASPEGFGGPPRLRGAQVLMMDGSTRFLSSEIAPEVLRALSTPAGGETLNDDWDNH